MKPRHLPWFLGVAAVTTWALPSAFAPSASAQPCPDVDVMFARGTTEAPGPGAAGDAFVDALRPRVGGRSLDVYPINYPATTDFATGVQGLYDAKSHIESTAANCPKTKMVLGGYSQGAAIMGFATSAEVPSGVDPADVPKPLAPDVADHVAAVTLFGTPSNKFMDQIGQPHIVIGPAYSSKTIEICVPGDPVCSDGGDWAVHNGYAADGTAIDQAADFAASHLGPPPADNGAPVVTGPPPGAPADNGAPVVTGPPPGAPADNGAPVVTGPPPGAPPPPVVTGPPPSAPPPPVVTGPPPGPPPSPVVPGPVPDQTVPGAPPGGPPGEGPAPA